MVDRSRANARCSGRVRARQRSGVANRRVTSLRPPYTGGPHGRPAKDLRDWIALLERENELVRVPAEVDPDRCGTLDEMTGRRTLRSGHHWPAGRLRLVRLHDLEDVIRVCRCGTSAWHERHGASRVPFALRDEPHPRTGSDNPRYSLADRRLLDVEESPVRQTFSPSGRGHRSDEPRACLREPASHRATRPSEALSSTSGLLPAWPERRPESNRPSRGLHDRTGFEVLSRVGRETCSDAASGRRDPSPPQRLQR